MPEIDEPIKIPVDADFSGFRLAMTDMQTETKRFGSVFSGTISSAIRNGKSFEDTLKALALRLSDVALKAGLKPLENLASGLFGQVASGLGNFTSSLFSGSGAQSSIIPFAKGGVVSSPTFFNAGSSLGVMGEAGSEAILPLSRGADGRLGVKAGGGGAPVNVTFNISTPDVQGFRKSEGQISAMLARTVGRGRRGL